MSGKSQAERITALESEVAHLRDEIREFTSDLKELLELKNKSMGAFWLITTLMSAGIVGIFLEVLSWFRG